MRVLGLMSGTSLDGVDAAVLHTDGNVIEAFGETAYRPYSDEERAVLTAALGLWEGPQVAAAAEIVQVAHSELVTGFDDINLIGFHGQTLAHAPREQGTLQVGDGAALAADAKVPVVWDFRSADVALGGEGAPLAPFYHFALAKWIGATAPLVVLNLGGVGNVTWVNPLADAPEAPGALLAFDTGPANAPINDFVAQQFGVAFDRDGQLAAQGTVETGALELFLSEPYFSRMPPKSLDRNDFQTMIGLVTDLKPEDAVATLTAVSAAAVAAGMAHCPEPPERVLVAGGGRKNPILMQMIAAAVDCPVHPVEEVDLDGDMLEAQAFAFLAARVSQKLPTSCPTTTGVSAAVGGGTVSVPGP